VWHSFAGRSLVARGQVRIGLLTSRMLTHWMVD